MRGAGYLETTFRRKRRRNSSPSKTTTNGIYFSIEGNKKILPALSAEDSNVVFSDRVLSLKPKMKLDQYQLIITGKQFYLFKDKSGTKKLQVTFKEIEAVFLSHQSDNFMLIKLKGGKPAVLIVSRRKMQIVQVMAHQTSNESSNFPLRITDRFSFLHTDGKRYVMVFTRTEFGVQTSIYNEAKDKDKDKDKGKEKADKRKKTK